MRAIPQLKRVREERALSQRDLAAISGVAHDTIGQLERGERLARPSTLRKLATALGVEPIVLLNAETGIVASTEQSSPSTDDKSRANRGRDQGSVKGIAEAPEWLAPEWLVRAERRRAAIEKRSSERETWEAAGKWAEYFVSGEATRNTTTYLHGPQGPIVGQHAGGRDDEEQVEIEHLYLFNTLQLPRGVDAEERNILWLKLESVDPRDVLEAAQKSLSLAKQLMASVSEKEASFQAIPEHYFRNPSSQRRIARLRVALDNYTKKAIEIVPELLDIHVQATRKLDTVVDEIKREADEVAGIVRQAQIAVSENQNKGGRES